MESPEDPIERAFSVESNLRVEGHAGLLSPQGRVGSCRTGYLCSVVDKRVSSRWQLLAEIGQPHHRSGRETVA